jgi:hypothetical protein
MSNIDIRYRVLETTEPPAKLFREWSWNSTLGRLTNYNENKGVEPNCHWGQRKLLFSEIEFLSSVGLPLENCVVVYVGAAGGHHIPLLTHLFPKLRFLLYDPAPFVIKNGHSIRIHTGADGWFSDNTIPNVLKHPWVKDREILFISDIRGSTTEDDVFRDMVAQQRWGVKLNAAAMLLKFRPPYDNPENRRKTFSYEVEPTCRVPASTLNIEHSILYLRGKVLIQIYGPNRTTETRLMVNRRSDGMYDMSYYDYVAYEQQLLHFNRFERQKPYIYRGSAQLSRHLAGYDMSYDSTCEYYIACLYLRYIGESETFENVIRLLHVWDSWIQKATNRNLIDCVPRTVLGRKRDDIKPAMQYYQRHYDYEQSIDTQIKELERRAAENNPILSTKAYRKQIEILHQQKRIIKGMTKQNRS